MFNALSAFRGRYRMSRVLQAVVLFVLLLRGLLSGAVMFDVLAPSGGFGLVLCSGAGAMFAPASEGSDAAAPILASKEGGMDGMMSMPAMRMTLAPSTTRSGTHPGTRLAAGMDSGICAFSAALCVAIVTLAAFALPFAAARRHPIGPAPLRRAVVRIIAYRFALSRAPPFRSILP